jgi:hypothetical protein
VAAVTGGFTVAQLKKGTHVAIFYIDIMEWSVGTLSERTEGDQWDVRFGRELWPYKFVDEDCGEEKLWVVVKRSTPTKRQRTAPDTSSEATVAPGGGTGVAAASAASSASADMDVDIIDPTVCAYTSVSTTPSGAATVHGCQALLPADDLNKCTERECNGARIHPFCYAAHFPEVHSALASTGKRLCPRCAPARSPSAAQ